MQSEFPKEGVFCALAIPTDTRGRVLKRALALHLQWLHKKGVHGVLALGSTGEFPRFSVEQRKGIISTVAELAGPLQVLVNVSDIRPSASAELARFSHRLGLPGVAIMPPSFYPMNGPDQLAFFTHVAEAAESKVMLYNFPELTCNRISIETIAAFADRGFMASIKQSGGEFSYHKDLISLGKEKDFVVFSGADTRLNEVFALGATGCIGGLVNFVPEYMVSIYNVVRKGAKADISVMVERMKEVGRAVDRLTFPLNVGTGLVARGFDAGDPKTVVSSHSQELFDAIVAELREKFAVWGLESAQGIPERRGGKNLLVEAR